MPPDSGGICMGVDLRSHPFAPGLPPGWFSPDLCDDSAEKALCSITEALSAILTTRPEPRQTKPTDPFSRNSFRRCSASPSSPPSRPCLHPGASSHRPAQDMPSQTRSTSSSAPTAGLARTSARGCWRAAARLPSRAETKHPWRSWLNPAPSRMLVLRSQCRAMGASHRLSGTISFHKMH